MHQFRIKRDCFFKSFKSLVSVPLGYDVHELPVEMIFISLHYPPMRCLQCQFENKSGRRFCSNCGAGLPLICEACGFENDAGDQFCGGCGAELTSGPKQVPANEDNTPSPEPGSAAERRHLTVMFIDLVGSTKLSAEMDPEDLRQIITKFQDSCSLRVKDFGGYVARLMGDGLLVYFGYPVAFEDMPERAVRAGLNIVEDIAAFDLQHSQRLQVRVGIATGLVVVGDLVGEQTAIERAVVGETPNLAARLQGLAQPDSVVISAATARGLEGLFEFEDLGDHQVKGFGAPVHAYRPLKSLAISSRFEAYHGANLTPLVGRTEEISFLRQRWSQTLDGEGQVVTLSGEAGIGKSRILEAMRARAMELEGRTIHFQCSPHHQSSFLYAFADTISKTASANRKSETASMVDGLEALARRAAQNVETTVPLFADLISVSTDDRYPPLTESADHIRNAILSALVAYVQGLARVGPLLCIFEDIHWIDPTSLDLLTLMIEQAPNSRIMFVITFRPEFKSPWGAMGNVAQLSLNRLGRKDSVEIANKVSQGRQLPTEVIDRIVARTDGVPLFVEELTKSMIESGVLREGPDGFELIGPLSSLPVPETLQDSLLSRLEKLAPVKEIAQIGAVIGREFSCDILSAVTQQSTDDIRLALVVLSDADLVFRRGWPPNEVYVFKHALVQDAIYESLLRENRRALHARAAKVLIDQFENIVDAEPETVAHHLNQAGVSEQAAIYWGRAGRRSAARSAHNEACAHFRNAVAAISSTQDRKNRLDLNLDLAASLRVLGLPEETLEVLAQAQILAREPQELSKIHNLRGNVYFLKGNADGNINEQQQALAYARQAQSVLDETRALSGLADASYMKGKMVSARDYFIELSTLARTNDLKSDAAANMPGLINTTYMTKGPTAARSYADKIEAYVNQHGELRPAAILFGVLAEVANDMMQDEACIRYSDRACELCDETGATVWRPPSMSPKALALCYRGDREAAKALMHEAMTLSLEISPALSGPWMLGHWAVISSDAKEIRDAWIKSEAIIASGCVGHNQFWAYRMFLEAFLNIEDYPSVDRVTDRLAAYAASEPLQWSDFFCARARALARTGRGDKDSTLVADLQKLSREAQQAGFLQPKLAIDMALERIS